MGFGGVIAGGFFILMFIGALFCLTGYMSTYSQTASTLSENAVQLNSYLRTDIAASDLVKYYDVEFKLSNTGGIPIKIRDFPKMDIVIIYTSTSYQKVLTRLSYSESGSGQNVWCIQSVIKDAVNPISIVDQTGILDPGEIVKIRVKNLSPAMDYEKTVSLVVSTPNGVTTTLSGT